MTDTVLFDVMRVCSWSFYLCFVGVSLFFVHSVQGQRTRDLIDLTPPSAPPASPPPHSTGQPSSTTPRQNVSPAIPNAFPSLAPAYPGALSTGTAPIGTAPIGTVPTGGMPVFGPQMQDGGLGGFAIPFSLDDGTSYPSPAPSPSPSAAKVPTVSTRQLASQVASVFEDATEDEQEERELQARRLRAEQIVDPDNREREMAQVERIETAYKNRQARRLAEEEGADLFYVPRLKQQFLKEGWCQLFDGHTETGWQIQTKGPYAGGKFVFGNNEIRSDPRHPGLLYSSMPFGDVTVRFDFCAEKDSEVFLLLKTPPDPADLNSSCYTFVLNSTKSNRPRGILLGRHGLTFADLREMRETLDRPADTTNEEVWHTVIARCEGMDSQFRLDRRNPMTYFDPMPLLSGHVAFLVAKGKVRFQNILWKPSPAISIFDTELQRGTSWRVADGADFAENTYETGFCLRRGTVESRESFDNFVLQMEYRQGKPSGRSSLFVRSLPGLGNTGYEISLQNFPTRKDRETIAGVDAGAFLEMKDARYVRAQDRQWTSLTVAAVDRQLQTWVNGVSVCEIHDRRKVQENFRIMAQQKGPFLQPGPIRWSVPEDNTLFEFRNVTVSPVPGSR